MSQKFLQNQSKLLNNTLSQFDNFYQPIGSKVNVYKFRKVSGSIYLTRYGEVPINTKSGNYQQTFQVFTGKEPIVVVWENSTKLIGNGYNITKKYQVGDYETCYLSQPKDISNEITTKNLYGKEYTMTYLKYNISLQSTTWLPSEDEIRDYLYLIFDKKSQSYKWLEIVSITPIYNEETNKIQYCEINFESINDKYTQTGKSILDFVQMGAIGEGYSFPKETYQANGEIVVELDTNYLYDLGCNSLQFDFTSGVALSSVLVVGRRKSTIQNGNIVVDKPHLLWLYDTQIPILSKFFYNQPNLNSYLGVRFQPTKEGIWKSYKDAYKGNNRIGEYNILNTKEVITGLKHDQKLVRSTNPNINTYTNWTKERNFFIDFGNVFEYDINPYVLSEKLTNKQCNYVDFLNINSMVNFASEVFDYDYKETKKWKLTDTLGILGNLVNIFVGGLDIGWTTSNILSQVPNDLNLIIPCISYEDGMLALDSTASLPLDVFYDDKSQKVLPTSTNVLTSWRFRLTDRVVDTSQIREGAELGKGGSGVWDLKYVGQKQFEDGTYINVDKTPFRLKLSTTTAAIPSNADFEFIVDYIDFKAIGSCDYRISGYDNANNSIYYSIAETNAKARGDIRIWGNAIKFNYYGDFNVEGQVNYPNYENPPKPNNDLIGFEILLNDYEKQIFALDIFKETKGSGNKITWTYIEPTLWYKEDLYFEYDEKITGGECNGWGSQAHCGRPHITPVKATNWPAIITTENKQNNVMGLKENTILTLPTKTITYKDLSIDFDMINKLIINFSNNQKLELTKQQITQKHIKFIKEYQINDSDNWIYQENVFGGYYTTINGNVNQPLNGDIYGQIKKLEINVNFDNISKQISITFDIQYYQVNLSYDGNINNNYVMNKKYLTNPNINKILFTY